jgi:hypothetical protein
MSAMKLMYIALWLLPWGLLGFLSFRPSDGDAIAEPVARSVMPAEPAGATSLTHEPYVHPRLVEELVTWVSDHDDLIVGIDLDGAQGSNRFCCDEADGTSYLRVTENSYGSHDYHYFGYHVIGRTDSGVYAVSTRSHDGGSASWHELLFLVIVNEPGLAIDYDAGRAELTRPRRILKKLGQTFLGDRWKGQLKVVGNIVYVGKDRGWYSDDPVDGELAEGDDEWERVIEVVYPPS